MSRHDYCTKSPDVFVYYSSLTESVAEASFRGPCARHDMMIDKTAKKKWTLKKKKKAKRAKGDIKFRSHLRQNCGYYLHRDAEARSACYITASVYYVVVSWRTKSREGK